MIRVALVEDDPELRKYLEDTLATSGEIFLEGSYGSAETFKKDFHRISPEIVIMDIHLPGISGIQCIEEMKPRREAVQYLVCTVFEDSTHLFNALCAGATGYILKSSGEEEIIKAIFDLQKGGSPMSPQIARRVVASLHQPTAKAATALTEREEQILARLAKGFSNKEIADLLNVSLETVRTHLRHIYEKLHVHSRTEAVVKYLDR